MTPTLVIGLRVAPPAQSASDPTLTPSVVTGTPSAPRHTSSAESGAAIEHTRDNATSRVAELEQQVAELERRRPRVRMAHLSAESVPAAELGAAQAAGEQEFHNALESVVRNSAISRWRSWRPNAHGAVVSRNVGSRGAAEGSLTQPNAARPSLEWKLEESATQIEHPFGRPAGTGTCSPGAWPGSLRHRGRDPARSRPPRASGNLLSPSGAVGMADVERPRACALVPEGAR